MTFGLSIEKRPACTVEPHQTPSWGWRWSCTKCGKANTRIGTEQDAHREAAGHDCNTVDAGRENPTIGLAPRLTVYSSWQWDERRRHEHY